MALEPLAISAVVLVVLMAFTVYYSTIHAAIKVVVFPLLIVAAISGWSFYKDNLGAPIKSLPIGVFKYVHHIASQGGEMILVWVYTKERGHRLHQLPYSRELMKDLEEAKDGKEGQEANGRIVPENESLAFVREDRAESEGDIPK